MHLISVLVHHSDIPWMISFKGEKFHSLLGSLDMWGKVLWFFHHNLHTSSSTKQLWVFQRKLTWILLKTVISILGNGQEYITDTCVCADFTLSRMAVQSPEKKSYSWSESEIKQFASRFLVSFFCKLLPNLLAETV